MINAVLALEILLIIIALSFIVFLLAALKKYGIKALFLEKHTEQVELYDNIETIENFDDETIITYANGDQYHIKKHAEGK